MAGNIPQVKNTSVHSINLNGQDNKMIYQIPDVEIQNNPEITVQNP